MDYIPKIGNYFSIGLTCCAIANADIANHAYQLRMNGKLEHARKILIERVDVSPNDAVALYELARTEMHIALGSPRQLARRLNNAKQFIDRAIAADTKNTAFRVFAGHVNYFRAYHAKQTKSSDLKKHFVAAVDSFEAAIEITPSYPQVLLYLVELHNQFPEDAGADRKKAKRYCDELEKIDSIFAVKGKAILSPDSRSVDSWLEVSKEQPNNADVHEELAKAYLHENQMSQAEKLIDKAIQIDPTKSYLLLDLSIFHTFRAMRALNNDSSLFEESVKAGNRAITRFLDSDPIQPMKAYALGVKSKYSSALGEKNDGQELINRAKVLDPFFSKATGAPLFDLFIPPTSVPKRHRYLTRPF